MEMSEFSLQIYSLISNYSKGSPAHLQNIFIPVVLSLQTMCVGSAA